MAIVDVLVSYRANHDITELGIKNTECDLEDLNVAVIEILSWLKLEHKRELWLKEGRPAKLKNLKLNMNYSWCDQLKRLIDSETLFSEWFIVEDGELRFRPEIDENRRVLERTSAYEKYNPQKIE